MSASEPQESVNNEIEIQSSAENTEQRPNNNTNGQYVAPLHLYDGHEGPPLSPNRYMVTFYNGHTQEKHWEVVGEIIGGAWFGSWYAATLSDDQIERIRRDPGVKEVRQYGRVEWG